MTDEYLTGRRQQYNIMYIAFDAVIWDFCQCHYWKK